MKKAAPLLLILVATFACAIVGAVAGDKKQISQPGDYSTPLIWQMKSSDR